MDVLSQIIEKAKLAAAASGSAEIGSEHLLYGITATESPSRDILSEFGVTRRAMEEVLRMGGGATVFAEPQLSRRVRNILASAKELADRQNQALSAEHILFALINESDSIAVTILVRSFRADLRILAAALRAAIADASEQVPEQSPEPKISGQTSLGKIFEGLFGGIPVQKPPSQTSGFENGSRKLPDSLLNLGVDMTEKARSGKLDPIIGRSKEIERIIEILCRKTKNNPVLIGEPGVGKSAVVEGLCQAIVKGEVPELLKNKTVFALDTGSLMAGTKFRGALEERLKEAIDAVSKNGNIILFIDELHTLATMGGDKGEINPADMLKPYLARGELQTVGATTTDEYRKFIEKDKALERRFQPITVDPPGIDETIEILRGLRPNYEKFHNVKISDEAIAACANLSDRYITDRFLPDKAIDLMDEASSKAKVRSNMIPAALKEKEEELKRAEQEKATAIKMENFKLASDMRDKAKRLAEEIEQTKLNWTQNRVKSDISITAEDIASVVAKWTNIPVARLNETETERLVRLEEILHKRVIGQDEAVTAVARAIRRARTGLKDPKRPIGSFIFLGPTGVGKTELTKALAEAMFDDENLIIRLDMSEYMESHSISKMIGSPPGYVGFDDGGQLTEQVRRKPYSVVLFDEIEKAHPDVFNMLLSMLDEGRLTDSQGRVVSFKNTIIVMTSNAGVSDLKTAPRGALGFAAAEKSVEKKNSDVLMNALKRTFKPEFLNRVDVITIFHALDKEHIARITSIMLGKVVDRLNEKNIAIEFSPECIEFLSAKGYDPEYGARPLRRIIEQLIEDKLAQLILDGSLKDGQNIKADIKDGEVVFA